MIQCACRIRQAQTSSRLGQLLSGLSWTLAQELEKNLPECDPNASTWEQVAHGNFVLSGSCRLPRLGMCSVKAALGQLGELG